MNKKNDVLSQLLNYRFVDGELTWTHLWNLIVWALSKICGSYEAGILELNKLLWLPVYVLPVSNYPAQICAELEDGTTIHGEWQIIKREKITIPIKRYYLDVTYDAVSDGVEAIQSANMIVICPWVLWTWIISTLLFSWIKEAIIQNPGAPIVYIANVMTYPSQTNDMSLSDHIKQLESYLWRAVTYIIINTKMPPSYIMSEYNRVWSSPLIIDEEHLTDYTIIKEDLLIDYNKIENINELVRASWTKHHVGVHRIRHDGEKVAKIIEHLLSSQE